MTYDTPEALRMALDARLREQAAATSVALARLRRRVVFERVMGGLHASEPGAWVLKGGMALEVRLGNGARVTKDLDLGLRDDAGDGDDLQDRVLGALAPGDGEPFRFRVSVPERLADDAHGQPTWRLTVTADLAGRELGAIKLDVSPRAHELVRTDLLQLPNTLAFADYTTPAVEAVDLQRHAAEKLHAMHREFGDRDNTRVRDLVDIAILQDRDLLDPDRLREQVDLVWHEREGSAPPGRIAPLPASWEAGFAGIVEPQSLDVTPYPQAVAALNDLWARMFTSQEL